MLKVVFLKNDYLICIMFDKKLGDEYWVTVSIQTLDLCRFYEVIRLTRLQN